MQRGSGAVILIERLLLVPERAEGVCIARLRESHGRLSAAGRQTTSSYGKDLMKKPVVFNELLIEILAYFGFIARVSQSGSCNAPVDSQAFSMRARWWLSLKSNLGIIDLRS